MNIDPANHAMTPWEQKIVRSEDAILESAKRGESITEQAAAGGVSIEAHWRKRQTDPSFAAQWLDATAIGNELRLHEAQARRAKRFKRVSSIVKQKTDAIEKGIQVAMRGLSAAPLRRIEAAPAFRAAKGVYGGASVAGMSGRLFGGLGSGDEDSPIEKGIKKAPDLGPVGTARLS